MIYWNIFMPESKHRKKGPLASIDIHATDISVARSRSAEPYIKSFIAAPENIAQESLGTLVGVFSVSEKSESSAYIVNTLASVAKKEYFINPRRGSIESFESTLHKMNVVLSELVKNGQTEWIGNLHGAIAAIEQYTIHFSVTGEGAILLFREGSLSDIGDGLASEEARFHPLKTFVEISTGRLNAGDYVLLASPELLTLFDHEELKRSARRIGVGKKFSQFLETAMINELKAGAVVMLEAQEKFIDASETKKIKREKHRSKDTINAWSAQAFEEKKREQSASLQDDIPAELTTDIRAFESREEKETKNRFGEIYIRGEISEKHEEHPMVTKLRWFFEDRLDQYETAKKQLTRGSKELLQSLFDTISQGTKKATQNVKKSVARPLKSTPSTVAPTPTQATGEKLQKMPLSPSGKKFLRLPKLSSIHIPARVPFPLPDSAHVQEVARGSLRSVGRRARHMGTKIMLFARACWHSYLLPLALRARDRNVRFGAFLARSFRKQSPKRQIVIMTSLAFLLTLSASALWGNKNAIAPKEALVINENTAASSPTEKKEDGGEAAVLTPVPVKETTSLTPVFLKNRLYVLSEQHIFDPESNALYPFPDASRLKYAVAMNDLNLIFILTQDNSLYAFAPSNQTFVKNAISLPPAFTPGGIGSFLTYVYFLEKDTGMVYRFPRAEGGFGEGKIWNKEPFPKDTGFLAVSEHIYGANETSLLAFLKGKPSPQFSFERPSDPFSITAICANPDLPAIFAIVDARGKRVLLMNENGTIQKQIFSPSLEEAEECALDASGGTLAISTQNAVSTIKLEGLLQNNNR